MSKPENDQKIKLLADAVLSSDECTLSINIKQGYIATTEDKLELAFNDATIGIGGIDLIVSAISVCSLWVTYLSGTIGGKFGLSAGAMDKLIETICLSLSIWLFWQLCTYFRTREKRGYKHFKERLGY